MQQSERERQSTPTRRFEQGIANAATRAPREQDALAALLLAEIEDERHRAALLLESRAPVLPWRLTPVTLA